MAFHNMLYQGVQGCPQKIFQGGPTEKDRKLAKKIALFASSRGGGTTKKTENSKKKAEK